MKNEYTIAKAKESMGKSGSIFFFTHDNKFILKTITDEELNVLINNYLPGYYDHV